MRRLLIADDSNSKILKIHGKILQSALKEVPLEIAMDTDAAIDLLLAKPDIGAGFIDYQIPSDNGPHIMSEWRRLEKERGWLPAYICLATSATGQTLESYGRIALEHGANEAISTSDEEEIERILELMRPYLLETTDANF